MSQRPTFFSDIGKKAREILFKDYSYDRKFSITTQTANGLALTSSSLQKESQSISDVAAQYKHRNAVIDVKVDTQSNLATTLTLADIMPSLKSIASVKLPDYNSGKLELQYFRDHAAFCSSVSFNKPLLFDVSATFGTPNTVIGVEAGYDTCSDFTKYNAGVSMSKPDYCASLVLEEKGDLVRASYVQYLDHVRTTAVMEFTNRFSEDGNTLTVGGSHAVDDLTLIKLKLNNQGKFGGLVRHEFKPKSVLTMAAEFDYNSLDTNPKLGISLALKP
ncbi:Mitochondrial outer membrane protein porin 2 [Bienertia sinuspersici]